MTEVRTALITGAARGIGRATALRFARGGFRVVACDRDGPALEETLGLLEAMAANDPRIVELDVTDGERVEELVATLEREGAGVDVLVNNAAIVRDALLVKVAEGSILSRFEPKDFDAVLDVDLKGVFLCTRAVAPGMVARRRGVILNATSIVAADGNFGQTAYAAAKAGVVAMTKVWARELGRHGLRVNAVAPGFVETEMLRSIPERMREELPRHVPLGRFGRPEEVAEAYFWLASDAASYVTGTVLEVDGGAVLGT